MPSELWQQNIEHNVCTHVCWAHIMPTCKKHEINTPNKDSVIIFLAAMLQKDSWHNMNSNVRN